MVLVAGVGVRGRAVAVALVVAVLVLLLLHVGVSVLGGRAAPAVGVGRGAAFGAVVGRRLHVVDGREADSADAAVVVVACQGLAGLEAFAAGVGAGVGLDVF